MELVRPHENRRLYTALRKNTVTSKTVNAIVRVAIALNPLCSLECTAAEDKDFFVSTTKHTFAPKISMRMQKMR